MPRFYSAGQTSNHPVRRLYVGFPSGLLVQWMTTFPALNNVERFQLYAFRRVAVGSYILSLRLNGLRKCIRLRARPTG